MGQVRLKIFMQHTILATLPSTYQNLLKFVEIWQIFDRNKNAVFFETLCIQLFASQPAQLKQVKLLKQCVKFVFAIEPLCDVR